MKAKLVIATTYKPLKGKRFNFPVNTEVILTGNTQDVAGLHMIEVKYPNGFIGLVCNDYLETII